LGRTGKPRGSRTPEPDPICTARFFLRASWIIICNCPIPSVKSPVPRPTVRLSVVFLPVSALPLTNQWSRNDISLHSLLLPNVHNKLVDCSDWAMRLCMIPFGDVNIFVNVRMNGSIDTFSCLGPVTDHTCARKLEEYVSKPRKLCSSKKTFVHECSAPASHDFVFGNQAPRDKLLQTPHDEPTQLQ
jgi:hypothetical protein